MNQEGWHDNSSLEISDEYDVMKHALGERRGHIRGVDRVVKSVPAEMSSSYNTQSQGWQQNWEQQMREHMQEEVQAQMNENLHKMQADFARQFEEMRQSFQQQKDSQNEEEESEYEFGEGQEVATYSIRALDIAEQDRSVTGIILRVIDWFLGQQLGAALRSYMWSSTITIEVNRDRD
ncbi:hypothetical protein E3N88_30637 [Mikania micrantha]|uniref:Uncharacterized protein n=1 Tax=Mikania micrantha TaxID=192012 RepID=A0A5N6MMN1_9ASTR|nr:hypothetical protein E3N88_30637 [Mikania micrantha]